MEEEKQKQFTDGVENAQETTNEKDFNPLKYVD